MKPKYFFANWKENGNLKQVTTLFNGYLRIFAGEKRAEPPVVVLPPVVYLSDLYRLLKDNLSIRLGVQDISRFVEGSYTGEVSAKMVRPFAQYALLGHSERRRNLNEASAVVNQKMGICRSYGLTPIVCVGSPQELKELKPPSGLVEWFLSYESEDFIGGRRVQAPDIVLEFAQRVTRQFPQNRPRFVYGGSLTEENIDQLIGFEQIEGFLVGHVSLDPEKFGRLVHFNDSQPE